MKINFLSRLGLPCAIVFAAASTAVAQSDTGQTQVTQNAKLATLSSSESDIWVNCVDEGKDCKPGTSDLVTTRYGVDGTYFFYMTRNVEKVPCKNSVNGDPKKGSDKSCQYTTSNVFNVPGNDAGWSQVAKEGKSFTFAEAGYFWVRYGTDGHYVYTLVEGSEKQSLKCENNYFGIDPVKKDKTCDIGPAFVSGTGNVTECAKEGRTCSPNMSTAFLIRYGTSTGWDTRFYRAPDGSFACNNNTFHYDPIKKDKSCFVQAMEPVSAATVGEWRQVASCSGNTCDSLTKSITYGTSKTSTWSTSAQWGVTVTASMEESFEILGVGAKVTESVATSFSTSVGYQDALTTSQSETLSATCKLTGSTTGLMYQFSTGTEASCVEAGTCSGTTLTGDYACIGDPPANYAGPQCVPGYCADSLCSTCTY